VAETDECAPPQVGSPLHWSIRSVDVPEGRDRRDIGRCDPSGQRGGTKPDRAALARQYDQPSRCGRNSAAAQRDEDIHCSVIGQRRGGIGVYRGGKRYPPRRCSWSRPTATPNPQGSAPPGSRTASAPARWKPPRRTRQMRRRRGPERGRWAQAYGQIFITPELLISVPVKVPGVGHVVGSPPIRIIGDGTVLPDGTALAVRLGSDVGSTAIQGPASWPRDKASRIDQP
jgi:hypothetical protein